jgi:nucleoside-diphosphate-sugar epimerase
VAGDRPFEGRRAAVTGAGGFIGGAVSRRLLAEGAEVVGIDVDESATGRVRDAGARAARVDVTDRDGLADALARAELVVHAAALVHEGREMDEFVRVNVVGTANVLDAAAAAGAERVVHVSSVVVYGYHAPGEQDESAQLRSYGLPYIDTKVASDRLARRRGAVVIRPGDVYGPGGPQWILRPAELARRGRAILPACGGTMLPVYVDDLVEAILAALERGEPGEAYTVWDGQPVSFEEHFRRVAEIAGGDPPRSLPRPVLAAAAAAIEAVARLRGRRPDFSPAAITYVERRGTVSNRRAREELGWSPRVSYDEGMRRTAEWLTGHSGTVVA